MIKTSKELAAAAENVARNYKTSYIWGGIGQPITEASLAAAVDAYAKNRTSGYVDKARRYLNVGYGFDCVCLLKSLLWGWNGDKTKLCGGAVYASNGVPDIGADQMMAVCREPSTDFSKIEVGELVHVKGHVGIYIGGGLAVECTPAWKCGVQITAVRNIGTKSGYNSRKWTKHGKLPWVTYEGNPEVTAPEKPEVVITGLPTLREGNESATVKALQILLLGYGYDLGKWKDDGEFGEKTRLAVEKFQREHGLDDDGVVGKLTWAKLLGVG